MAELDDRYYKLKNQRSSNEYRQRCAKNEMARIDQKIKRLQKAYNDIDWEKEYLKNQRRSLGSMSGSFDRVWKGEHASNIYYSCNDGGSLNSAYKSYINKVDAIEDAINNEICNLKNRKAEQYGILQGLIRTWNNLTTQIRNYFN